MDESMSTDTEALAACPAFDRIEYVCDLLEANGFPCVAIGTGFSDAYIETTEAGMRWYAARFELPVSSANALGYDLEALVVELSVGNTSMDTFNVWGDLWQSTSHRHNDEPIRGPTGERVTS